MYPRRHHAVIMEREQDIVILFHCGTGEMKKTNEMGALLWSLCDGKHSLHDMVAHVKKTCTDVPETVDEDVQSFIHSLGKAQFVESVIDV